jgi:acetyl esterase/lipase
MRYKTATIVLFTSLFFWVVVPQKKSRMYLFIIFESTITAPKMNILCRNSKLKQLPVLIFVHGGYWNSGRKGTYDLLGRNFAQRVVVVIPDYTLVQIRTIMEWPNKLLL